MPTKSGKEGWSRIKIGAGLRPASETDKAGGVGTDTAGGVGMGDAIAAAQEDERQARQEIECDVCGTE